MLSGTIDPITEYDHTAGTAVVGGYVYRGSTIPSLVGTYVYGDYSTGRIWGLYDDPVTGESRSRELLSTGKNPSSFGEDVDGEIYFVTLPEGAIYRFIDASSIDAGTSDFPTTLTATGCVDPNDATRPAEGVIPYSVNAALWSDGADKERFLALPDGASIHVADDGDWELPIGSVLLKTFALGARRIETRMLVRHTDGDWAGYAFEWNDQQTDATLLPAGQTKTLGTQSWYIPSRSDCLRCHTVAAGRTLGLETAQLDRDQRYPNGVVANQLATLEHIGLFDAVLASKTAYPVPTAAGALEARARAYLHANCSMCHRTGGPTAVDMNLLFSTSLSSTRTCGIAPSSGDLGISGALRLVPGDAARSLVALRMQMLNAHRMPPLATSVVDVEGAALIEGWVSSLTGCP